MQGDSIPPRPPARRRSQTFIVEPTELLFSPPHRGRAVQNVAVLCNTGDLPCVFKVKSNAPSRYLTRPTMGTIPPNGAVRIHFILRPQESDIPPSASDVFRLHVKAVPASELQREPKLIQKTSSRDLWELLAEEPMAFVRDLRCGFRPDAPPPTGALITVLDPESLRHDAGESDGARGAKAAAQVPHNEVERRQKEPEAAQRAEAPRSDANKVMIVGAVTQRGGKSMQLSLLIVLMLVAYVMGAMWRKGLNNGNALQWPSVLGAAINSIDDCIYGMLPALG